MDNRIAAIDKRAHANIKIKPNPDWSNIKNEHLIALTIGEIGPASNDFPVVLLKKPETGDYRLAVVLGFEAKENLYFDGTQWHCGYMPLAVRRHPFVIGRNDNAPIDARLTTCLEMDSPLVNETEGQPLFLADGSESEFLQYHQRMLAELYDGEINTQRFLKKLAELDLIYPFELELEATDRTVSRVTGLYTINEQKLQALPWETIAELHKSSYLPPIYFLLNSLGQFRTMVRLKNARTSVPIVDLRFKADTQSPAASPAAS